MGTNHTYKKLGPSEAQMGDYPIVLLDGTPQQVANHFGPPHAEAEPYTEPGPCFYWGLEFTCGLQVVINAYEGGPVKLCSNRLEPQHILVHLDFELPVISRFTNADLGDLLAYYRITADAAPWDLDTEWAVVRQDDHGHRFEVGRYTSEQEARCVVANYEGQLHKQTFWVEAVT